jgi:hypothetical protein
MELENTVDTDGNRVKRWGKTGFGPT